MLDQTINSMTEFKQIIGRGTRIREDFGKRFFTLMDFRHVTRLFADPEFDGEPVQIYEPGVGDPVTPPESTDDEPPTETPFPTAEDLLPGATLVERPQRHAKYYVDGVDVRILAERVQYVDKHGVLRTLSFQEFSRENLHAHYASLDDFLKRWQAAERKEAILEELSEQGFLLEKLQAELSADLDPFDLICHVAFDRPALTRSQRAKSTRQSALFDQYGGLARRVLEALVDKYADQGIAPIEAATNETRLAEVLQLPPFDQLGMPVQVIRAFGNKQKFIDAVRRLELEIYRAASRLQTPSFFKKLGV